MRLTGLPVLAVVALAGRPSVADTPALTIELVDAEPVSVRVGVVAFSAPSCALAQTIFEGVLEKGKPVSLTNDASRFCVSQTQAPFTKYAFGSAVSFARWGWTPTLRLLVRSRPGADGAPPVPRYWSTPLTVRLVGAQKISVRVSAGTAAPCFSALNVPIYNGLLEPNVPRAFHTDAACVCFEQALAPFVAASWSTPTIRCRPMVCEGKFCSMDVDAPFELALSSLG